MQAKPPKQTTELEPHLQMLIGFQLSNHQFGSWQHYDVTLNLQIQLHELLTNFFQIGT